MFADMVGYTALMQEDESGARAQRDQHRSLLAAAVARRNGEILQYYGDGTLCIFASAVEAVECAVAVQLVVNKGPLLPLRIGIHTGDIVHDPDGVYGDGVNVASRIEGLAAPGGVMISSKVFDEIKNHHSLSAVSIGVVRLKKLETHLKIFAISNEGLAVPTENEVRAKAEKGGEGAFWSAGEETVGDGGMPVTIPPVGMGEAFLQRVKDRAVAQWALVYVAAAWVVLKIVEFAVDRLAWSPTIYQGVELLTFAGFFTTLVLAWYHGEKGRHSFPTASRQSERAALDQGLPRRSWTPARLSPHCPGSTEVATKTTSTSRTVSTTRSSLGYRRFEGSGLSPGSR
jgi:hypothetical protein